MTAAAIGGLLVFVASCLVMFGIGWLGARACYREPPRFDDERGHDTAWAAEFAESWNTGHGAAPTRVSVLPRLDFSRPRCHACGAMDCPAAGAAGVDACPAWQEAEARNARGEYLTTRSAPGAFTITVYPPPLDPDTDRLATVQELADHARYRLTWDDLDRQVDEARAWYDRTFQTGQFRAIGD